MEQEATQAAKDYATAIASTDEIGIQGSELGEMLNRVKIQSQFREEVMHLRIPQFFLKSAPDLFCDDSYDLLEPDNLSEGFVLSGQDAQISFELTIDEIYRVDIQEQGEAVPKYKRAGRDEREYVRKFLATLPPEQKVRNCIDMICKQVNRSDRYTKRDIEDYVRRIVARMTDDELKTSGNGGSGLYTKDPAENRHTGKCLASAAVLQVARQRKDRHAGNLLSSAANH